VLFWVRFGKNNLIFFCNLHLPGCHGHTVLRFFSYNNNGFSLQITGLCIFAIGLWAWNEKDIFNNFSKFTNVALDPAFVLIVIGIVTFIIGFTGCVGALRENTCLLSAVNETKGVKFYKTIKALSLLFQYAIFLAILLVLEMSLGVLTIVLKDKGWVSNSRVDLCMYV
jgi:tetraspanin-5